MPSSQRKISRCVEGSAKVGWIIFKFLARGTKHILEGENKHAHFNASIAIFFQQVTATLQKTQAQPNNAKISEMIHCDEHTLVKYLRKLIPCECVDEKYKEVKSITRMGFCINPNCSIPGGKVERKGMLHCIRCLDVNYCSRECQEAHWPSTKKCVIYMSIGKLLSKPIRKTFEAAGWGGLTIEITSTPK